MKIITGKTGENHVTADDDRSLYAGIFGENSYVLNIGQKLASTIVSANTIRIGSGDLVHNGTHARIAYGDYEDVSIDNGTTGYYRKDLIVARYTKSAGIESMDLVVIKGTPSTTDPVAPEYYQNNILQGATISDMPLYAVTLNGVNLESVTSMFQVVTGMDDIYRVNDLVKNVNGTTIDNTPGNFFFSGYGDPFPDTDWVGFQADSGVDTFQIVANGYTLMFRENDRLPEPHEPWTEWLPMAKYGALPIGGKILVSAAGGIVSETDITVSTIVQIQQSANNAGEKANANEQYITTVRYKSGAMHGNLVNGYGMIDDATNLNEMKEAIKSVITAFIDYMSDLS